MNSLSAYEAPTFDVPIDLDLSKNEGTSPARELIASLADPTPLVRQYPDMSDLRAEIASLHDIDPASVLVTAGGDDALSRCFLACVRPGHEVVSTYPTFEMISRYTEQREATLRQAPWWSGPFPSRQVAELITAKTDAAFIVSPNNPTGVAASADDIEQLGARVRFLVLDAAYTEFADEDLTLVAFGLGNAVVVRTLSKAYGLAGLRVGYLMGPPELIASIGAYGNPYSVSALSAAIAVARLRRPAEELRDTLTEVRRERVELTSALTDLGAEPTPSQANFILARSDRATWLSDASASLGVALRTFPGREGLEDAIRITIPGRETDFDRLLRTLKVALRPEALLFDLDGVLADVSRSQTRAIIETAQEFGVKVDASDIENAKAEGSANDDWALTHRLVTQRGVDVGPGQIISRYERRYQGDGEFAGLKEEESLLVEPALWQMWADAYPIAIVTGRPRSDAEEFLSRFGLLESLDALVAKEDGPLKPDPAPVTTALGRLGASRAWMLGDTVDDISAARLAGVVPIGVIAPGDDPVKTRRTLNRAARVLSNINELEDLLP